MARSEDRILTPDDDVQDQDDETDNSTASTILPAVAMGVRVDSLLCHGEGQQGELNEEAKCCRQHDCSFDGF